MFPHSANFSYHGPHSTLAYENHPPPPLHPKHQRPPTITEENVDTPLQMHHHSIMDPTLTTVPAPQKARTPYPHHQAPPPVYPQPAAAGISMPSAIGQHATSYRHQEEKGKTQYDVRPPTFSPPDGSYPPQLRSWYSEDSSYTHESLRQMQLDATKHGETQGLPREKRGLSPSESLPLNFDSMKDDSDEEGTVTKEIRKYYGEIMEETSSNRVIKTDLQKPFDPNLVCPTCKKQFRIGEIQKYKRHANNCGKK